ncbi:hypothetical protein [Bacillus niameyensis]|uniref:hypothetical protein n=1 Tax=Bacillus niameyensis TaxID=1522308 RepID=UPI001E3E434D|nr:hypothetical protein [Bacillus niameyensis]
MRYAWDLIVTVLLENIALRERFKTYRYRFSGVHHITGTIQDLSLPFFRSSSHNGNDSRLIVTVFPEFIT